MQGAVLHYIAFRPIKRGARSGLRRGRPARNKTAAVEPERGREGDRRSRPEGRGG